MIMTMTQSLMLVAVASLLVGHTAAANILARAPELRPAHEVVQWVVKHGGKVQAESHEHFSLT